VRAWGVLACVVFGLGCQPRTGSDLLLCQLAGQEARADCPPLALAKGELVRLGIDPRAAELKLTIRGPAGALLSASTQDLLPQGLAFVATASADYRLEVHLASSGRGRPVEIPIRERRAARPSDEKRIAAENAFAEGSRLHREDGSAERANALFTEALDRWRQLADAGGQARALSALGASQLRHSGCSGPSLQTHERALDMLVRASPPDPLLEVTLRRNFAGTCLDCDRLHEGLRELNRALELTRRSGDVTLQARVLSDLGNGYTLVSRLPDALSRHREALALLQDWARRHPDDPRHTDQAEALFELGASHHHLGDSRLAFQRFEESLALFRAAGKRHGEVRALNRLSSVAKTLGKTDRALEYNQQAFELNRLYGSRRTEGYILHNRGHIYLARANLAEAEKQYRSALAIRRRIGYASGIAASLTTLAQIRLTVGDPEGALPLLREVTEIFERVSGRVPDSEHRPSSFSLARGAFQQYVALLRRLHRRHPSGGYLAEAFDASERARARGLLDTLTSRSRKPLTLTQIQRELLDTETLLLQYWLSPQGSLLFLVSTEELRVFDLAPESKIETLARRVHERLVARQQPRRFEPADEREARIEKADADYETESARLSRMILAPVAPYLRGRNRGKRLLIAAEGALELLPFSALPDPGARPAGSAAPPLMFAHEVSSLPSVSILAGIRQRGGERPIAPQEILVFADPVFGPDDERLAALPDARSPWRSLAPGGHGDQSSSPIPLPRLRYTTREARAVERLVSPPQHRLALGFAATRALAMSAEVSRYRIIHFATHALLDSQKASRSAIVLSRLTPDGRRQDGMLRQEDIVRTKLAADLVVLSSCSTGVGEKWWGEGMLSLTRAFLQAGASAVVMSLWEVDDAVTSELMSRVLERLLGPDRPGPAAALREAQLALWSSAKWRAPYYWAAFGVHGEYGGAPRPTQHSEVIR
jgi:CHAT domain-containing protein/tetratricopeptide (TPR) repeat protein